MKHDFQTQISIAFMCIRSYGKLFNKISRLERTLLYARRHVHILLADAQTTYLFRLILLS